MSSTKNNTVQSLDVIICLENASQYYDTILGLGGPLARVFITNNMITIINSILEKKYDTIESMTKKKVVYVLRLALEIVCKGLSTINNDSGDYTKDGSKSCWYWPLHVLAIIFDKTKRYYSEDPLVRINQIKHFSKMKGFIQLSEYYNELVLWSTASLPPTHSLQKYFSCLHPLLESLFVTISITQQKENKNVHSITTSIMIQLIELDNNINDNGGESMLVTLSTKQIHQVLIQLQRINKFLVFSKCQGASLSNYYTFCQKLVSHLIHLDTSVEHKYFGLKLIKTLIESTHLPRSYIVKGAGLSFVNGKYELVSSAIENGCITGRTVVSYERKVGSSTLKIHPCIMSEYGDSYLSTWWFLSDANDSRGGRDYYFHKSAPHEHDRPPSEGWDSCPQGGIDPAPSIEPQQSDLVPIGEEEHNTLEHQLSKWMVQNKVFDTVANTQSSFMETPSTMIKFLSRVNDGKSGCSAVRSVLDQKSRLLEPIISLLSEDARPSTASTQISFASSPSAAASSSPSSAYFSAIGAAKQRLASAELWRKSTESSAENAMKEYMIASNEVQNARSYLNELEQSHEVINVDDVDSEDEVGAGDKKKPAKRQRQR